LPILPKTHFIAIVKGTHALGYAMKKIKQWGAFYLFIADFFATQIIGGTNEIVVLL
jgi:hypothetical protein